MSHSGDGPVVLKRGGHGHCAEREGMTFSCLNKRRVRASTSLFASPSFDLCVHINLVQ